jgi:membrane protein
VGAFQGVITFGVFVRKFVLPGAAAFAAAALSLCLGGGMAHAQESAEAAPVQVPSLHVVNTLGVSQETPEPSIPVNEVLNFLSDSINLAGYNVLSSRDRMSNGTSIRIVDARSGKDSDNDDQDSNAPVHGGIGQVYNDITSMEPEEVVDMVTSSPAFVPAVAGLALAGVGATAAAGIGLAGAAVVTQAALVNGLVIAHVALTPVRVFNNLAIVNTLAIAHITRHVIVATALLTPVLSVRFLAHKVNKFGKLQKLVGIGLLIGGAYAPADAAEKTTLLAVGAGLFVLGAAKNLPRALRKARLTRKVTKVVLFVPSIINGTALLTGLGVLDPSFLTAVIILLFPKSHLDPKAVTAETVALGKVLVKGLKGANALVAKYAPAVLAFLKEIAATGALPGPVAA